MTKDEFLQEAALRLITARPEAPMGEIADLARDLAGEFFHENESDKAKEAIKDLGVLVGDDPISVLISEIDRLDEEEKRQLTEKAKTRGWNTKYQKSGYAERVGKLCNRLGYYYVTGFVCMGRSSFRKERQIGEKCAEIVDKALLNLYGIKSW